MVHRTKLSDHYKKYFTKTNKMRIRINDPTRIWFVIPYRTCRAQLVGISTRATMIDEYDMRMMAMMMMRKRRRRRRRMTMVMV